MADTNGVHTIPIREYKPDTLAVHADDRLNSSTDVAPALHVSTTFRYNNAKLNPISDEDVCPKPVLSSQWHVLVYISN